MDFVENHEPVEMRGEIQLRLGELREIPLGFEVEVHLPPRVERGERKRRLSGLSRAEKDDCGRFVQASGKRRREPSVNHVCNYGIVMYDLHECFGGGRKLSVPSGIRG